LLFEMVRQQIGDDADRAAAVDYWRDKAHAAVDAIAERYKQREAQAADRRARFARLSRLLEWALEARAAVSKPLPT
jgi:hypothetical protein